MNKTQSISTAKIAYSLAEASEMIGVSQGHLRNEQARGKLIFVKSGRRVLITDRELQRYLAAQAIEGGEGGD